MATANVCFSLTIPANVNPAGGTVRTAGTSDHPMFHLPDVCDALGVGNPSQVAARLEDDEKGIYSVDTLGGTQKALYVSAPGLYRILATARVEKARPFQRWLFHDVLPSIFRHGCYPPPPPTPKPDPILALLESAKETRLAQLALEQKQHELEAAQANLATAQASLETRQADTQRLAEAALATAECNHGMFTVMGYANIIRRPMTLQEASIHGRALSRICRQRGIDKSRVRDTRCGFVGAYPESVLDEYFRNLDN